MYSEQLAMTRQLVLARTRPAVKINKKNIHAHEFWTLVTVHT